MVDTLDLVVVGYKKDTYYTLAAYNEDQDIYIVIGIIDNKQLPKTLKVHVKFDERVVCMFEVDDWFYPELVVEVSVEKLSHSISPQSPFFLINPQFIKIRTDKNPEHATTLKEVESLYKMQ